MRRTLASKWCELAAAAIASLAAWQSPALAQVPFAEKRNPTPGEWSARAVYLGFGLGAFDRPGELRVSRVASPDSKKIAVFEKLELSILKEKTKLLGLADVQFTPLSEVLWSPDSQALAITWSDGGYVGTWRPRVFLVARGRVQEARVVEEMLKDFAVRFTCEKLGDLKDSANVAVLHWIKGSSKLLLVAEVPNHSSCKDMGSVMGYIVSVPSGKVLQRLSLRQLRAQWGQFLGERLGGPFKPSGI